MICCNYFCVAFFAILVALSLNLLPPISADIRPDRRLSLLNDEGFVAYLEVAKNFGTVKHCWFQYQYEEKRLVDMSSNPPIITQYSAIVRSYSASMCGIRVNKLSTLSAGRWALIAENDYKEIEEGSVFIKILPLQKTNFETKVQTDIGKGTISCTKNASYTKHCKIFDETGNMYHQCELYTNIRANSSFKCHAFNWGRMEPAIEHIVIEKKNSTQLTEATLQENDFHYVLRCMFVDTLHSCQAETPNGKDELYIMDGLYNGRYSAYDTIVAKSRCSLEIPKPLNAAEIGVWRIINYESGTGCLYYVGKNSKDIIENEVSKLSATKVIRAYESDANIAEIYCMVPFSIDDCYLRDPNNTVYFGDSVKFARQRLYGKCAFSNVPVIGGTWSCGARGRAFDREVVQTIEVEVKSKAGEVVTPHIQGRTGQTVQLMCKSAFEEPIAQCVFIHPDGAVHLVGTTNSIKTAGHVHYFGRGIQVGECGVKINQLTGNDFGQWKCQFLLHSAATSSSFQMSLSESETAHASSVGLGVGIAIIVVLIFGVALGTFIYRRRNLSAAHNFPSADPLEFSESNEPSRI